MPARNVVSSGLSNANVRYSRLASDDDGYIDLQVTIYRFSPPVVLRMRRQVEEPDQNRRKRFT